MGPFLQAYCRPGVCEVEVWREQALGGLLFVEVYRKGGLLALDFDGLACSDLGRDVGSCPGIVAV